MVRPSLIPRPLLPRAGEGEEERREKKRKNERKEELVVGLPFSRGPSTPGPFSRVR